MSKYQRDNYTITVGEEGDDYGWAIACQDCMDETTNVVSYEPYNTIARGLWCERIGCENQLTQEMQNSGIDFYYLDFIME